MQGYHPVVPSLWPDKFGIRISINRSDKLLLSLYVILVTLENPFLVALGPFYKRKMTNFLQYSRRYSGHEH